MTDIAKYLKDLKSPNPNKRFDACYHLRRLKEIPESGILALQEAINDSDALVAKEARNALEVHQQSSPLISVASNITQRQSPFSNNFFKFFFGGGVIIFLGVIAMFIVSFLANGENGRDIGTSFIGVVAYIVGQFLFVALVLYLFVYGLMTIIRSTKK